MTDYLILILFDQHSNSQTLTLIALQLKPKLAKEATRQLIFVLCLITFLIVILIIGVFIVILMLSIYVQDRQTVQTVVCQRQARLAVA